MGNIVLALGFFDGIHLGHGALLDKTKERAKELGLPPAVFTFDRHPRQVITGKPTPLINSAADRQEILHRIYGIERIFVCPFTEEVMHLSPRDFIRRYLHEAYGVAHVVAGHDFHFGYRNEGNPQILQEECAKLGIGCDIVPRVELEGITVSSSYIRELLQKGEMARAGHFLGHPYSISGTVRHGLHIGTTLGVPTVNLDLPEGTLVPAHGVYLSRVFLENGKSYPSLTNIGVRPTVKSGSAANAESFLLDFSGDLYGQTLRLELYDFLRPEAKFDSLAALQSQITQDIARAKEYFKL